MKADVEYPTDPALWTINEDLISYCILKGPSFCRNDNCDFTNSVRLYDVSDGEKKKRSLQQSLFSCKLKNGETIQRDWLLYSPSKGCVYCFVCRLFSCEHSSLSYYGFNDWKNVNRIKEHEQGREHKQCLLIYSKRKSASGCIDDSLIIEFEKQCSYWKELLFRLIKVIKFIASRGLAFRGSNEKLGSNKNGNYLGLLELISDFDPFLKNHFKLYGNKGKGVTSYLSANICEEIIESIGNKVFLWIVSELKKAKYYSISVDSTPDVTHTDQLTFIVRYVNDYAPIERFLKFIPIESHTGEYLSNTVISFLEENNIPLSDCRGQSYDNAANMAGAYSGLSTRFKEINQYADFIPCAGHSLNLIGVKAAACNLDIIQFFKLLQKLYTFFSASTNRWQKMTDAFGKKKVVKSLSETRWSARSDAVIALHDSYDETLKLLYELSDDGTQSNDTRLEASSLYKKLNNFNNVFLLVVWNDILSKIHLTNLSVQKENISLAVVVNLLNSLESFLRDLREQFNEYLRKSLIEADLNKIPQIEKRLRKRSNKIMALEGPAEDTVFDTESRLKINIFYPIIDSLCVNIRQRKKA